MLWILGKMLVDFTRALRANRIIRANRYLVHGAIAVIGAILAEGMFEYNLGDSEILTMFLVVTSSAYAVIQDERAPTCESVHPVHG
jgi:hypothetical protein